MWACTNSPYNNVHITNCVLIIYLLVQRAPDLRILDVSIAIDVPLSMTWWFNNITVSENIAQKWPLCHRRRDLHPPDAGALSTETLYKVKIKHSLICFKTLHNSWRPVHRYINPIKSLVFHSDLLLRHAGKSYLNPWQLVHTLISSAQRYWCFDTHSCILNNSSRLVPR